MPRSAGITASAIVVFIGSAFTLLFAALMLFGGFVSQRIPPSPDLPANLGLIIFAEAAFFDALGAWGLATGFGLLKTRQWARISLMVFAVILVVVAVPAAAILAIIPMRAPSGSKAGALPPNFFSLIRYGMGAFYASIGALGGWWLYYFNTRPVTDQFRVPSTAFAPNPAYGVPAFPTSGAYLLDPSHAATSRPRPISVTILAWFLIVTGGLMPLYPLYFRAMYPGFGMPVFLLGFLLQGAAATAAFVFWGIAYVVVGVGLLKFRNWARITAIGLQVFGILNFLPLVAIPSKRQKFQEITDAMMASLPHSPALQAPFTFPAWIGLAGVLPIAVAITWILIANRSAFASPTRNLSATDSP